MLEVLLRVPYLFVFADGKLLSRSRFVDRLRKGLREDPTTATVSELEGVENCIIKTLGRWESSAYLQSRAC